MANLKYTFVTGRLAEKSLVRALACMPVDSYKIQPLECSVAALMTTEFIARHLRPGFGEEHTIVIPGLCQGELEPIAKAVGCHVLRGPKDLWELPRFLQREPSPPVLEDSRMQIVAEIVDASRMEMGEILDKAAYFRDSGADIIDLGGNVHGPFRGLGEVIRQLKAGGFRVSVDSHITDDILTAGKSGADLVLSLTSQNLELAKAVDCPVVLIPDDGESLESLCRSINILERWRRPYLADPILPPPCMGLARGIERYARLRREHPGCPLFMGLGNVSEMIDADSVGVNAILTMVASELSAQYVLTTEVSRRAHGTIREIALARSLAHQALAQGRVPKYIDERLLVVKEPAAASYFEEDFRQMQSQIKDANYRIFTAGTIYCFNAGHFVQGHSAGEVFAKLEITDPGHAFYLGRELERAQTALLLGKKYTQDSPLRWGYLSDN